MKGTLFWRIGAAVWAAGLAFLLLSPEVSGTAGELLPFRHGDKLAHLAGFTLLATLLYNSADRDLAASRLRLQRWILLAVGTGLALGLETGQLLVPTREFDLLDLAMNLLPFAAAGLLTVLRGGDRERHAEAE